MDKRLFFAATQRNKNCIGKILEENLPKSGFILEIGSGSGEHAVTFQKRFPKIKWQASDPNDSHRQSIKAWIDYYKLSKKMFDPISLSIQKTPWLLNLELKSKLKGIVCINLIHVMPLNNINYLFKESAKLLKTNQFLLIYGPFKRINKPTIQSNIDFDLKLKKSNQDWGIRNLEFVNKIAKENNFLNYKIHEMPANNLCIIYKQL